eukprot:scaffold1626_cov372-Prasinococcus_capsulatus_cf.AAC.10
MAPPFHTPGRGVLCGLLTCHACSSGRCVGFQKPNRAETNSSDMTAEPCTCSYQHAQLLVVSGVARSKWPIPGFRKLDITLATNRHRPCQITGSSLDGKPQQME